TVAMRAYTQTTPTWVRGILGDEYGVDLGSIRWLSQEGAHVAEYEEPSGVGRLDAGRSLPEALLNGEVDAFIAGSGVAGDDRLRGLIPDAAQAALDWHQRTGIVPINHMVAIRRQIADTRPDIVREIFRMLCESRRVSGDVAKPGAPNLQPNGFAA